MTNQINELKKENSIFLKNKNDLDIIIKEKEDVIYQLKIDNDEYIKKLEESGNEKQKVFL